MRLWEFSYAESDNIRSYGILPAAYETVMLQEIAKAQGADTSAFVGFNPFCGHETGDPAHIGKGVRNVCGAMACCRG